MKNKERKILERYAFWNLSKWQKEFCESCRGCGAPSCGCETGCSCSPGCGGPA